MRQHLIPAARATVAAAGLALLLGAACGDDRSPGLAQLDGGPALTGLGDAAAPTVCADADDCGHLAGTAACAVPICGDDGVCALAPGDDGATCDGVCATGGVCAAGACVGGAPVTCDDGDPCTVDACDPALGCVAPAKTCPNASPCEVGACDPGTGACTTRPLADGDTCVPTVDCLVDAVCDDGACVGTLSGDCDDGDPCTDDACTLQGCAHTPVADDRPCDDEDACTSDDRCAAGVCQGAALPCDDQDSCTADRCEAGACLSEPIPGCVPTPACEELAPGAPCDDGDAGTVADICLADVCRGFTVTTIAPPAGETWRITQVDRHGERWFVGVTIDDAADEAEGLLARLDLETATPVVAPYSATRRAAVYSGLEGGFAADDGGRLWEFVAPTWSNETALADALDPDGRADGLAVVTDADGTRVWLVGEDDFGGPWLRRCATSPIAQCLSQPLLITAPPVVRAIARETRCNGAGRCDVALIAGGDLFESTGADGFPRYFNDVYQTNGGVGSSWSVAAFDPGQSNQTTERALSLGDERFLVAGGFGYLRENTPDGTWGNPLVVVEDQDNHHFRGAWAGAGIALVTGFRLVPGGRELVALSVPAGDDISDPGLWKRFVAGTGVGPGVGLYDVHGLEDGTIVMVGGLRATANERGQGVVMLRRP